MTRQGLFADVPEGEYHADRASLAQSGAKLMLKSPAHYRWDVDHPKPPSDRFDFGSAAHKLVLGVGPDLVVHEYDPVKVKSPKNTNAWKTQKAEVRAAGGILLLPDEAEQVTSMAENIKAHRLAMELLSAGQPEVTAYAADPVTGVLMRGRFDWLGDETISDYKTAASSDPDEFARKAVSYGYDLQASWYLDLAEQVGHPAAGFAHIVQEIDPPYVVSVIILPAELLERGRILKHRALAMYRDCVEAGAWPGYLPDTEFATPAAPAWALRDLEEV